MDIKNGEESHVHKKRTIEVDPIILKLGKDAFENICSFVDDELWYVLKRTCSSWCDALR